MMSNSLRRFPMLLALGCAMSPSLVAADASHPCATVAAPAERLACYDRAFPPPAEVYEAAEKKAVEDFGFQDRPEKLRNPGQSGGEVDPDQIEGRVSKVEYGRGNSRTFRLENGQAWQVTEASSAGYVTEGDTVVVRKGVIGSYQLITPSGVSLRVRRVR